MKKRITNLSRKYIYLKADSTNMAEADSIAADSIGKKKDSRQNLPAMHPNRYWASPLFFDIDASFNN